MGIAKVLILFRMLPTSRWGKPWHRRERSLSSPSTRSFARVDSDEGGGGDGRIDLGGGAKVGE